MFTFQVIQWNTFLVLCLGIWWRHEILISKILKFDFLKNEKSFWSETKNVLQISQVLSCRLEKQTSKNVADLTFKVNGSLRIIAFIVSIKLLVKLQLRTNDSLLTLFPSVFFFLPFGWCYSQLMKNDKGLDDSAQALTKGNWM